ncbi:saccharopine dehydrogenase C-terminal domain-containing protein [Pseudomonas sp. BW7P1]|uniref:saccharopine dehydrogenase C-terminal domain-containing protein n=1 Tax=Pseudomonas TaxID=286 RepID=UPI0021AD9233|nr:saccharopine dehydrogenase C-terminal domain-containing protein [Pseudomonas sp. BW7P1]UWI59597.1 saccharopine dehydrogenase NADP-binding domain-containing protein [Pseudomonas sp. BW7P1]
MKKINRIVIVGFGSIAQALMPLLVTRYDAEIIVFDKTVDEVRQSIADEYSACLIRKLITPRNFKEVIGHHLNENTFLLNLAVSVSSEALIALAQSFQSLYLDTCIEPWEYSAEQDSNLTSNFSLRESLKYFSSDRPRESATAIVAHGANPGFISVLLKKALTHMAALNGITFDGTRQQDWAGLSRQLGIRVIQISERDTQFANVERSSGHFVCTWSVDGLITECLQPAEMGWGSHETQVPEGATLNGYALALKEQGREIRVKSWSPNCLDFTGYLLTHNESLSIAEYLTLGDAYRPTVYYAYHPCDQAVESMSLLTDGNEERVLSKEVLKENILSGIDELGVFLISDKYPSLWMGSNLSIGKARNMARHNSATSLQVVSSIVAGMAWAQAHPQAGVLESEALDWKFVYDIAETYWQPIVCQQIDWRPTNASDSLSFNRFLV